MRRLLIVALLAIVGCATGGDPATAEEDMLVDVLQATDEAPPTYLYTVLVSNISGKLMRVNAVTVEPRQGGDIRFKNGNLTTLTDLEPGQQGEFRLWVDIESDSGYFDREGPPSLRVVVSFTIDGQTRTKIETVRVQRAGR
jgi:hypothetical protein